MKILVTTRFATSLLFLSFICISPAVQAQIEDNKGIVAKNAKVGVINAIDVTGANPLVNGFQEPLVVGVALGKKPEETSKLIDGNNGVYMIKTKKITKAVDLPNYLTYKNKVSTNNRQMVAGSIYSAMENGAKIKDNRHKVLQ